MGSQSPTMKLEDVSVCPVMFTFKCGADVPPQPCSWPLSIVA